MVCLLFINEVWLRNILRNAFVDFLDLLGHGATNGGDAAVRDRESG